MSLLPGKTPTSSSTTSKSVSVRRAMCPTTTDTTTTWARDSPAIVAPMTAAVTQSQTKARSSGRVASITKPGMDPAVADQVVAPPAPSTTMMIRRKATTAVAVIEGVIAAAAGQITAPIPTRMSSTWRPTTASQACAGGETAVEQGRYRPQKQRMATVRHHHLHPHLRHPRDRQWLYLASSFTRKARTTCPSLSTIPTLPTWLTQGQIESMEPPCSIQSASLCTSDGRSSPCQMFLYALTCHLIGVIEVTKSKPGLEETLEITLRNTYLMFFSYFYLFSIFDRLRHVRDFSAAWQTFHSIQSIKKLLNIWTPVKVIK